MTVYICTSTGLWRKWLNRPLSSKRVKLAARVAADYFESVDLNAEFRPDREFWLECRYLQPYNYLAVSGYRGFDERLQHGAELFVDCLTNDTE